MFLQVYWIDVLFALFTDKNQRAFELLSKTRVVTEAPGSDAPSRGFAAPERKNQAAFPRNVMFQPFANPRSDTNLRSELPRQGC